MSPKPSRAVTRAKCATCGKSFKATRRDARYCSGRCRQRALRARAQQDELRIEIEKAKRANWVAVRRYAEALGVPDSEVLTGEAQFVDEAGNVWIRGQLAGHKEPDRDRAVHGLEAAGPPWSPPTDWIHETFGPARVDSDLAYRAGLQAISRALQEPCADCPGPLPLPDGSPGRPRPASEFTTVIADPPWSYNNTASRGAADNHYPTMSTEEICGLFDRDGS